MSYIVNLESSVIQVLTPKAMLPHCLTHDKKLTN